MTLKLIVQQPLVLNLKLSTVPANQICPTIAQLVAHISADNIMSEVWNYIEESARAAIMQAVCTLPLNTAISVFEDFLTQIAHGANLTLAFENSSANKIVPFQVKVTGTHPNIIITATMPDVKVMLNNSGIGEIPANLRPNISLIDLTGQPIIPENIYQSHVTDFTVTINTQTEGGFTCFTPEVDPNDFLKFLTPHPVTGHVYRFVGKTFGYQYNDVYYNAAGAVTTEALALPLNIIFDLAQAKNNYFPATIRNVSQHVAHGTIDNSEIALAQFNTNGGLDGFTDWDFCDAYYGSNLMNLKIPLCFNYNPFNQNSSSGFTGYFWCKQYQVGTANRYVIVINNGSRTTSTNSFTRGNLIYRVYNNIDLNL